MKRIVLMMTAFLLTAGMNFEAKAGYETKWCRDASFVLRNSLEAAYEAESFEQEAAILKRAINKTRSSINPKFTYYLESSLSLALKLEPLVTSTKDKVFILRRSIDNALDDLDYLDDRMSNRRDQDHTEYVTKILERVSDEASRSKTDKSEITILNAGARSAVQILGESDNRRDRGNACAVRYLKESLQSYDVRYKRSLISDAINSIGGGCR